MIGLPNSTKGATKGHVVVSGPWTSLVEHPGQEFEPRYSLAITGRINHNSFIFTVLPIVGLLLKFIALCAIGKKKRGQLVEWVEKASFDRLNKLFVISASERYHQTLLTD